MIKAAIFDMDGTILDTIEDLTDALNHSLNHFGYRSALTTEEAKACFGSGARFAVASALKVSLGQTTNTDTIPDDATVDQVLAYYKPYYATHSDIKTGPYPGIMDLMQRLARAGISTAVVSNKPDPAVQKLCEVYFPGAFDFALGEQAGIPRKPAPDMVKICLENLQVTESEAVYIGDTEVDVQTASGAGLSCIGVDWGFRSKDALTGADAIVSNCDALAEAIITQV